MGRRGGGGIIASNGVGGQRISGQRTGNKKVNSSEFAESKRRTNGQMDKRIHASNFASPHDDVADDDRKLCPPKDCIRPITLVVESWCLNWYNSK